MKCKRLFVTVLALAAAAGLWAASWASLKPAALADAEAQPICMLREENGRLAEYEVDGKTPLRTYPIYTHLLPEKDLARLRDGILIYSEKELQALIEDFGG